MPHLSALDVCLRQGAVQIHLYLTLLYLQLGLISLPVLVYKTFYYTQYQEV